MAPKKDRVANNIPKHVGELDNEDMPMSSGQVDKILSHKSKDVPLLKFSPSDDSYVPDSQYESETTGEIDFTHPKFTSTSNFEECDDIFN